ncbi:hypothetical protein [Paludibaculum fermentans]|uniref:hypothetical protein n=1 Tax=Paludibaculum fermentans TaxID=1473598 RepID=UPI003EB83C16
MKRFLAPAVLGLACLFALWLAVLPAGVPGSLTRVLHVLGVFALMAIVNLGVGYLFGLLALRRQWSPFQSRLVGLPLFLCGAAGLVRTMEFRPDPWFFGLMAFSTLAGQMSRKVAYPEVGWLESDPPEHSEHRH